MSDQFEKFLEQYAELIVRVGLNIRAGQRLIVRAPVQGAPLARLVATSAYRAGARLVDVMYDDEELTLARYQYAPRDSFNEFPAYRTRALEEFARAGDAMLSIYAENPDLLKGQDPQLIATAQKTAMAHARPYSELVSRNATNWLVVAMPIPSWAAKVFPGLSSEEQMQKLWQTVFKVTRIGEGDAVALWQEHVRRLDARRELLNHRHYTALKYRAPGTDLSIGLPEKHLWFGGRVRAANGIDFIPNMPTEEVFTVPHRERIDGTVIATMPLSYAGTLIENFSLTFKNGRVVDFTAEKGGEVLRSLLDTDEGARSLGEVALVPQSSPVAQAKMLFYNTLFDENASCHLAFGRAYRFTLQGGEEMSAEQFAAEGGNFSLAHIDFMVGSNELDVDGVTASGDLEPLMRGGEWVTPV